MLINISANGLSRKQKDPLIMITHKNCTTQMARAASRMIGAAVVVLAVGRQAFAAGDDVFGDVNNVVTEATAGVGTIVTSLAVLGLIAYVGISFGKGRFEFSKFLLILGGVLIVAIGPRAIEWIISTVGN